MMINQCLATAQIDVICCRNGTSTNVYIMIFFWLDYFLVVGLPACVFNLLTRQSAPFFIMITAEICVFVISSR